MVEQFDLSALEKALSVKERGKKKPKTNPAKPLFVAVDNEGKEVTPEDIEADKTYGLKQNS